MKYNRLGRSGLKVSALGYGSWITFAKQMGLNEARRCMHVAFERGVNFFDNAEAYARGGAESLMGEILRDFRREDIVVSTKLYWGGDGPNDVGLSRKHLFEGIHNSLKRLRLEYVDLLFCHRPDVDTPIEETVFAMNDIVRKGLAFYWGTSEWSAAQLQEAFRVARDHHLIPPTMEQPQYNLFHRERVELEYRDLYEQYGLGLTTWSPLASGILSGKYANGIPDNSRFAKELWQKPSDFNSKIEKAKRLQPIAERMNCSLSQLSIAFCLYFKPVSSVILGATTEKQLLENLGAVNIAADLSPEIMSDIEALMNG